MASAAPPVTLSANDRVVLYNVDWEMYVALRKTLGDRPIRLTYDGSNLEIVSPSRGHERAKTLLGRMVEALTVELNIPMTGGGSMTFQRSDVERGLEPDECFWVANESLVREKEELDFRVDPTPDLVIEIDVSPSRLDRPAIYAKLQVPELWIFDGEDVRVELLNRHAAYLTSPTSVCFPFLPVHELARFVALGRKRSDTETLRLFIDWVREQKFQVNRPGEE